MRSMCTAMACADAMAATAPGALPAWRLGSRYILQSAPNPKGCKHNEACPLERWAVLIGLVLRLVLNRAELLIMYTANATEHVVIMLCNNRAHGKPSLKHGDDQEIPTGTWLHVPEQARCATRCQVPSSPTTCSECPPDAAPGGKDDQGRPCALARDHQQLIHRGGMPARRRR